MLADGEVSTFMDHKHTYYTLFYYSKLNRLTTFWISITCLTAFPSQDGFGGRLETDWEDQVLRIYTRLELCLDLILIFFPNERIYQTFIIEQ